MLRVVMATGLLALVMACGGSEPQPVPVMVVTATPVPRVAPPPTPVPTPTPAPTPTPVPVRTVSFAVQPNAGYEVKITTTPGARLELEFRSDLDINFRLLAPNGEDVGRWERVETLTEVQHTSSYAGEYRLEFDNTFSLLTPKKVTLDYRVVPQGGR